MQRDFARRLRREQTDFERKLWFALRDRRFSGFKFRRQQPIGPYFADFVCFARKLVIELDGSQHGLPENVATDRARTEFLEGEGFQVLRFWNFEVDDNFEGVMETIWRALVARRTPHRQNLSV